jgi:hypothetical protein
MVVHLWGKVAFTSIVVETRLTGKISDKRLETVLLLFFFFLSFFLFIYSTISSLHP